MQGFIKRALAAGVGAMLGVLLLIPATANAATANTTDTTVTNHIARALGKAPRGITNWKIEIRSMVASGLGGSVGREGTGLRANTVYGSCGSAWMAIGNQGAGHAWIAFGWDIYYSAYSEAWATGVAPRGSSSGGGAVAPWSSTSWDNGYSAWEGYWVWTAGTAYMTAYLYPWEPYGACSSNGPTSATFVTP